VSRLEFFVDRDGVYFGNDRLELVRAALAKENRP
jgi:2-hydroxychromene-2-carboxylate isomerase